jgi:hypothetical protein
LRIARRYPYATGDYKEGDQCPQKVYSELQAIIPNHGPKPTIIGVNGRGYRDKKDCPSKVPTQKLLENYGRKIKPKPIREVSHHKEKAGSKGLDGASETFFQHLVGCKQGSRKIAGQKKPDNEKSAEDVTDRQLEK